MHILTHTHTHTRTLMHILTHTRTLMHTHTHSHAHAHTYSHSLTQVALGTISHLDEYVESHVKEVEDYTTNFEVRGGE